MEASEQQVEAQLRLGWKEGAEFPAPLYANYLQASFTPEDFSIVLGVYAVPATANLTEEGIIDTPVEPVARLVLPLNLMRNVIALLKLQVDAYERSFGAIAEHPNKPPWLKEREDA